MDMIPFTKELIPQAEMLVRLNHLEERNAVPCLPDSVHIPPLDALAANGLGAAAVEDGKLLGFLCAYGPWKPVFYTKDVCGVFSPVHAHGVQVENRSRIWHRLYQAAAEKWVGAGAASHAITLYAHDTRAKEALYLYGFGARCMDLMRMAEPLGISHRWQCRELPAREHELLSPLRRGLSGHLAQSPSFMKHPPEDVAAWIRKKLEDPPRVFVAETDGVIAAYIEVSKDGENYLSAASDTLNICGAYCLPEHRGSGAAQAVLAYILETLRAEGFARLGVDCETFNPTALGFWRKYFTEYTHSVVRRIDENAL